ncbi:NAD(P)/FAD-dependent oxidoreductase [Cryptosporangium minutisporangium]|uniref:FAD/NAD(P)-binding oxidoreductase n=1 Tax=Cryptosporangium minutisporangium TaxID=113569 RepID=A0ABP6ST27_9ACTN
MQRRAANITRLAPQRSLATLGPADRIVIVGGGPAGTAAGEELRRLGFRGQIQLLCADPGGSYDRPACSKGLITGAQRPKDARIGVTDKRWEIDWRLGRTAIACDMNERVVWAQTGEGFRFDGLVIANGARPMLNSMWSGAAVPHIVHDINDAWEIRRGLRNANRVAIVGGGFTGCELACSIRGMGKDVTLIHPRDVLMNGVLDGVAAKLMTDEHAEDGVDLRLGRRVKAADRIGANWTLTLDDGSRIRADMVVMTAGEKPDIAWLAGTGIDISDGVVCDDALRVLDDEGAVVPGVVAAGALAKWPNRWMNGKNSRCGQWIAALEQGQAAARSLLAGDAPTESAILLPRYWTQQLGLRIQVCGDIGNDTEVRRLDRRPGHRKPARTGVLTCHYRGKDLVGVVAVNAPTEFVTVARELLYSKPRFELSAPRQPVQVPTGVLSRDGRRLAATG